MSSNRRQFLETVTAAGAVATLSERALAAEPTPGGKNWFDRPMRWVQLVFTEDDPGNYDPRFWLDYMKRVRADAACLGGGGYMAFYPTKVPLHNRSRFLGDRDVFGEMVHGCRKLGMNVIARTDPHAVRQNVYDAHPDWIAVDAEGRKRRHWANPELWVTCALGPMNFEFMTAVNNEIVGMYGIDGIFSNRWAGHGQCFCEHCRKNFREFSGLDLPRTNDPQDPARRAYLVWHEKRLFDCWKLWDSEIRRIKPEACFIANSGGGALSALDMKTVGDLAPILFADRQARRGTMAPWASGKNAKEYRAGLGRKPIGGITSVGVEEAYRWKDSVQHGEEIQIWLVDGIANGLRPWVVKFNGKPYDRRWLKPVEQVYTWHAANERYLRNEENLARVAVVFSQQTAKFYGAEQARAKCEDHILGWYQALVEARIPFEMVHDRKLDGVSKFKTLILPNIAALSEEQCRQLAEFVERGGSIVATHETSLCDEWGKRRPDFGLARLFAAKFDGKVEPRMQNSYIQLHHPHPLLKGLEDTPRTINGVARVHTRSTAAGYRPPLTLIPTYPDLPMEDVYPRSANSGVPVVHCGTAGKGRVVYFPWDIDRTFWEVFTLDHLRLMRNAVDWATAEPPPVSVNGRGVLDVTVWRQKNSLTVHLVNLTNPFMMKGPLREVIPVGPFTVHIRLPQGATPKQAKLLVSGRPVTPVAGPEGLRVEVPSVGLHEVVAVDLT
ncbi:MAG: beta-galactosidase trimerization domain-containing protein [Acidobacteria bacterium]|nr:beta-galactosidase trimerization domain-containing protein [Acidobacteriota bacterium]